MKKLLIALTLLCPLETYANDCVIIGFRGLKGQFDQEAFEKYAQMRGLYPIALEHTDLDLAMSIIEEERCYHLYGFSKGAETVMKMVRKAYDKLYPSPIDVITIGAYKSANVDFRPYNIRFKNYYDKSGEGQKTPGTYVAGIPHMKMQQYVLEKESEMKK
jgi:hypothetical protein